MDKFLKNRLEAAVSVIDSVFGKDYAKANPVLVAGLLQSWSLDSLERTIDTTGADLIDLLRRLKDRPS